MWTSTLEQLGPARPLFSHGPNWSLLFRVVREGATAREPSRLRRPPLGRPRLCPSRERTGLNFRTYSAQFSSLRSPATTVRSRSALGGTDRRRSSGVCGGSGRTDRSTAPSAADEPSADPNHHYTLQHKPESARFPTSAVTGPRGAGGPPMTRPRLQICCYLAHQLRPRATTACWLLALPIATALILHHDPRRWKPSAVSRPCRLAQRGPHSPNQSPKLESLSSLAPVASRHERPRSTAG